jgi:hypothetical protein
VTQETEKKIEILTRITSGLAAGAALGATTGLALGGVIGSFLSPLPGVGTIIGAAVGGAIAASKRARDKRKTLSLLLDAVSLSKPDLREDIATILDAKIILPRAEEIKEKLIQLRIFVEESNLSRFEKKDAANSIMEIVVEIENAKGLTIKEGVNYFLQKLTEIAKSSSSLIEYIQELSRLILL